MLKVPYRAFEAENPKAVADAIAEIDKLERNPIRYQESIPEKDLSWLAFAIAAAALTLLLLAKLAEVRLEAGTARAPAATPSAKPAARATNPVREAA
jgi:mxaC protein